MKKTMVKLLIKDISPFSKNEKIHTNDNISLIKESIKTIGYITPIVVDEENVILAGHGRWEVMKNMPEFETIEVLQMQGLTKLQKDKFRIYDNQSSRTGHYDNELLLDTLKSIIKEDETFNISILGIEGLAEAFSTSVFDFDLGKELLEKRTNVKKYLVVISEDLGPLKELLASTDYKYIIGNANNK